MMVAIQAGEGGYCIVGPAHNTQVTPSTRPPPQCLRTIGNIP